MQETLSSEAVIAGLLDPALRGDGYAVVCVKLTAGGRYQTLQVMAERLDGKPMTVQDCVAISHKASRQLEAAGSPPDSYTLEVSAPGNDRPLVRIEDFERFAGHSAVIEMRAPVGGRQYFQGRIVRVREREKEAELELNTASGSVRVPMRGIAEARLTAPQEPFSDEGNIDSPRKSPD